MKRANFSAHSKINWKASVVLCIGAAMVCVGLSAGDYHGVLNKAILICLECIGIG